MLLSSGERISCSLLAMAIDRLGRQVVSFTGSQAGIVTDGVHGRASIVELRADRVREALDRGKIALVAGFQGVSRDADVTTLGRGGSDTSAVALAGALEASVCEIYTDVDGVYTANPSIVAEAHRIAEIDYDLMSELTAAGAEVLAPACVELAARDRIAIHVRSSFSDAPGTWVRDAATKRDPATVVGVTYVADEASLEITGMRIDDANRFVAVARAEIAGLADVGVLELAGRGTADVICCLHADEIPDVELLLARPGFACSGVPPQVRNHVARVSVVGNAVSRGAGSVQVTMGAVLDGVRLGPVWTASSGLRASCLVPTHVVEQAVNDLHAGLGLNAP
jgi:aspartate kinase